LVTQKVELVVTLAFNGEYNFNIIDSTSSALFTNSLPNSSIDFLDNVQLSISQDEIKVCSLLPKLARCVKYLLSFSGSIIDNFSVNASNIALPKISSSICIDGKINLVTTS
jgi:hypothetical protein